MLFASALTREDVASTLTLAGAGMLRTEVSKGEEGHVRP